MLNFQAFGVLLYLFKGFAVSASGSTNGVSLGLKYLFKQMMTKPV